MSSASSAAESPTVTSVAPAPVNDDGRSRYALARAWKVPFAAMVIMIALALVGVALTMGKSEWAPRAWIALVPIYGLLCVFTAWDRARRDPRFQKPGIVRQVIHWLGIGLALWLAFYVRRSGEETVVALGDNALLLLALGCFLAGVHLEWLFAVVGLLLMLTLVVVVQAEEYIWLIFVVSGVAIVGLVVIRRLIVRKRKLVAGDAKA